MSLQQLDKFFAASTGKRASFPHLKCIAFDCRIQTLGPANNERPRSDSAGEKDFCGLLSYVAEYARFRDNPLWICVKTDRSFQHDHRLSDAPARLEWTGSSLDLPRFSRHDKDSWNSHIHASTHRIRIDMTKMLQVEMGDTEI